MYICRKCGKELTTEKQFCDNCGAPVFTEFNMDDIGYNFQDDMDAINEPLSYVFVCLLCVVHIVLFKWIFGFPLVLALGFWQDRHRKAYLGYMRKDFDEADRWLSISKTYRCIYVAGLVFGVIFLICSLVFHMEGVFNW